MYILLILIFTVSIFSIAFSYQRSEYLITYDKLNPYKTYGEYKTITYNYFNKINDTTTYFVSSSLFSRTIDKEGALINIGAYKDWNKNLYTYSSISFGTNSNYLPRYRLDHEFYFKTLKDKNLVLSLGSSYIKYFNVHSDLILSVGFTYYRDGYNFTYKYLINNNNPGSFISYTNIYSLGIGYEKKYWLYLNYNVGDQSYLATYLINPIEVNNKSYYYSINYRKWTKDNSGFIIEYNYLNLKDSYTKNGFVLGIFKEY